MTRENFGRARPVISAVLLFALGLAGMRPLNPNSSRPLRRAALGSLAAAAEPVDDQDVAPQPLRAVHGGASEVQTAPTVRWASVVAPPPELGLRRRVDRRQKIPAPSDAVPPF